MITIKSSSIHNLIIHNMTAERYEISVNGNKCQTLRKIVKRTPSQLAATKRMMEANFKRCGKKKCAKK